ncbi:transcriptional regulator [Oxalobacteraceae bacterium OM1]|nr:transcriptional regulator [Oxalobacteraceae bacterium OM1]
MNIERYLSQRDAATLCRLAEQLLRLRDVHLNHAERLVEVISSAILLPEHAKRTDCVCLQAEVTYRYIGTREPSSMVLVSPQDANETLARVSILTPLALALIGRRIGHVVEIAAGAQRVQFAEIIAVQIVPPPAQLTDNHGGTHALHRRRADQLPFVRDVWPRYGT